MDSVQTLFSIAVFILSVMIHEVSHGYMAYALGDPTAKYAGRLTLNPLKHLDMFGSVILPLLLIISKAPFIFGWAKPVPYNPYNLGNKKWGDALVAVAGPASNFALAIVIGLGFRVLMSFGLVTQPIADIVSIIVFVNLLLGIFNLIPIPPLDGSKILMTLFPFDWKLHVQKLEPYFFIILLVFIFTLWGYIFPVINFLSRAILGF